jgi:hypothetical protein
MKMKRVKFREDDFGVKGVEGGVGLLYLSP